MFSVKKHKPRYLNFLLKCFELCQTEFVTRRQQLIRLFINMRKYVVVSVTEGLLKARYDWWRVEKIVARTARPGCATAAADPASRLRFGRFRKLSLIIRCFDKFRNYLFFFFLSLFAKNRVQRTRNLFKKNWGNKSHLIISEMEIFRRQAKIVRLN